MTRQFPHTFATLPGHDETKVRGGGINPDAFSSGKWADMQARTIRSGRRTAADFLALPDDPDEYPDIRIIRLAQQLAAALSAGELDTLPPDTRAALALMPMALLDVAGDVRVLRLGDGR